MTEHVVTDYPRFEPVNGEPDTAHRHYHGGRFVDCVLRIIDGWRGRRARGGTGTERASGTGAIEIHERPLPRAPSGENRSAMQRADPMETLDRILLEAYVSRDFVITSARTRRLQAGVLVAFALILIAILVQDIRSAARSGAAQEARKSQSVATESISRSQPHAVYSVGVPPMPLAQQHPGVVMP